MLIGYQPTGEYKMAVAKNKETNEVDENQTPTSKSDETMAKSQAPGLDLNDLAQMLNLVDLAIDRGAYKRNELSDVISAATKLETFLDFQVKARTNQESQGEV